MKKCISFLLLNLAISICMAQNNVQSVPTSVTVITKESLQSTGRFHIDLIGSLPLGKLGENYAVGAGAKFQIDFSNPFVFIDDQLANLRNNKAKDPFLITSEDMMADALDSMRIPGTDDIISRIFPARVVRSGFHAELGYNLLIGKTETFGSMSYKTDNLSVIHAFAGYHYKPSFQTKLEIAAGPALGLFKGGGSEFGYGISLNAYYDFLPPKKVLGKAISTGKTPCQWSVGAGLDFYKLGEADPLILINAGARYNF